MTELAFKLEELIPMEASFKLAATGQAEHVLRIPSIEDNAWMKIVFKGGEIHQVLSANDKSGMVRIVYRLLKNKELFMAYSAEEIDDEGVKRVISYTGPQMLAKAIVGYKEQALVYQALMSTVGLSKPVLENIKKKAEEKEAKLKQEQMASSSETGSPAGPTSLTSSPTNTDGQSPKSEAEPSEK